MGLYLLASTKNIAPSFDAVINGITASSAKLAAESVLSQLNVYISLIGGAAALIIFIVGFIGFSQLRDIKNGMSESINFDLLQELRNSSEFRRQIKAEIEADSLSDIGRDIRRLEKLINISRLRTLSEKVMESQSFSNEERDFLLQSLINLKDDHDVTSTPEYKEALRHCLSSFYAAGLWSHLDRIDENLSQIISNNAGSSSVMLDVYARRLLGEMCYDEQEIGAVQRKFLFYSKSLMDLKYAEVASLHIIAFYIWKEGKSSKTDRLVLNIESWTPQEIELFFKNLARRVGAEESIGGKKTPESITLAEKYKMMLNNYQEEFAKIKANYGIL